MGLAGIRIYFYLGSCSVDWGGGEGQSRCAPKEGGVRCNLGDVVILLTWMRQAKSSCERKRVRFCRMMSLNAGSAGEEGKQIERERGIR